MRLDARQKDTAQALLHAHWKPPKVAEEIHCHHQTIYTMEHRIQMYGIPTIPPSHRSKPGPHRSVCNAAKESLFLYIEKYPWLYQDEMVIFLKDECEVYVSCPTVNRLMREHRWTHKQGKREGPYSQFLRNCWQAEMIHYTAEQLVFIDESLLKSGVLGDRWLMLLLMILLGGKIVSDEVLLILSYLLIQ